MDAHLRDLRYFVAVAEELSFTRAAERLHVSQPALSKQIRGLEQALRAQLLDRDRRRVALTAAGEALLAAARQVLAEWERGTARVTEVAAEQQRTLRVGTLTPIGRALYPAAVADFTARLPDWRIELRVVGWTDATAGLRDGATDAAFLWLPMDTSGLDCQVLLVERRFVAVGGKHRLAHRTAVEFRDIADEPFVALPPEAGPLREFWLGADRRDGVPARVVAEVMNADEKFEVVSSGVAIGLVSEANAALYARPDLVCIPVTDLPPASMAVARRRGDRRLAVQAFMEACTEAARDLDDGLAEPGYVRRRASRSSVRGAGLGGP